MTDLLGLIAELAVGFTGFAAIASLLGRSPTEADLRLDRFRLRNLVEMGVFTVVMALFPAVFEVGGARDGVRWTVCSVLMLLGAGAIAYFHIGRARSADISSLKGYSRAASVMVYMIAAIAVLVLLLGLIPAGLSPATAYVWTLFLWVVMLGVYFVRIASSLLTHRLDRR